jgi:ABC-type uncharacterized transport system ATPase subunit
MDPSSCREESSDPGPSGLPAHAFQMTAIRIEQISHSFGSFKAVEDVSLSFRAGEVLALVGENGAGKTTLMRIVAGELRPSSGVVLLDDEPVSFRSPRQASAAGIEIVHQHLMLISDFTIAENLALAGSGSRAWFRRRDLLRAADETIGRSGMSLPDPGRRVSELSVGERAKLEVIKAVTRRPALLILDEPTSVLTPDESASLFELMRRLCSEGTAVVLISHKLPEVFAASDRIAVMRGGRLIRVMAAVQTDPASVVRDMLGGDPAGIDGSMVGWMPARPPEHGLLADQPSIARLRCSEVSTAPRDSAPSLRNISFEVGAGEIVSVVGVAGNGQSELAQLLRGIQPRSGGLVQIDGRAMSQRALLEHPAVGHIPEDRTRDGLVAEMTITENLSLASDRWNRQSARANAKEAIALFSIRARGPWQPVGELSGGNQQKMILARELGRGPSLVIAAEPTRGLDLGSAEFVHQRLRAAAESGTAILLITSDLDEAYALSGAVHVMYGGRLSRRMTVRQSMESAGALMAGLA